VSCGEIQGSHVLPNHVGICQHITTGAVIKKKNYPLVCTRKRGKSCKTLKKKLIVRKVRKKFSTHFGSRVKKEKS
jgi:hypothetical protein